MCCADIDAVAVGIRDAEMFVCTFSRVREVHRYFKNIFTRLFTEHLTEAWQQRFEPITNTLTAATAIAEGETTKRRSINRIST